MFINAEERVKNQILDFTEIVQNVYIHFWKVEIKDAYDIFDIAQDIYNKAKGTCSEKVFIMINTLELSFNVEEMQVWKSLQESINWNPYIKELQEIYLEEFLTQDRKGLKEKYKKINERMKKKRF